jgi:hypothetical protein
MHLHEKCDQGQLKKSILQRNINGSGSAADTSAVLLRELQGHLQPSRERLKANQRFVTKHA